MPSLIHTLQSIVKQVDHAADFQSALNVIVDSLVEALKVDACSIFIDVPGEERNLVMLASRGLNREMIGKIRLATGEGLVGLVAEKAEPIRLDDALGHRNSVMFEGSGEEAYPVFLGVPIIAHRHALGVIVAQRCERPFDNDEEAFLSTLAAQLAGAITQARNSGEMARLLGDDRATLSCTLDGVAGAPGMAMGVAVVASHQVRLSTIPDKRVEPGEIDGQLERFEEAVSLVHRQLMEQAEQMSQSLPAEECALFVAYAQMLETGSLIDDTLALIRDGQWAPGAWRQTVEAHAAVFEAMEDEYLAERANDIRDLGRRVLQRLMSVEAVDRVYPEAFVLVGESITASDLASVPLDGLQGIVSEHGSGSSHVAILAHALGIPAVMGVTNLPHTKMEGMAVVVDGYGGHVHVDPPAELLQELQQYIRHERQVSDSLKALKDKPAVTTDGCRVSLYVNSGLMADLTPSLESGAEGVGLYRTEIPFQIRESFPSEEDQYRIYRDVLQTFGDMPVVLRTLDVGGDKPLSYFPIREENPFLGWRGIRISLDHPDIFITQLRAMIRANVGLDNLHILLPMISGLEELDDALILVHRAKDEIQEELGRPLRFPQVGAMIEVPSTIFQIDEICRLVDFVSIGTNDLTQYLLAVDRNNEAVAELFSSLHPSVLRAIEQVVQGAKRQDTPVSVCGELAGDPIGVMALIGMGIGSLSMSAGSLPRAKKVIRSFSQQELVAIKQQALELYEPEEVRELYTARLDEKGLGDLIRAQK